MNCRVRDTEDFCQFGKLDKDSFGNRLLFDFLFYVFHHHFTPIWGSMGNYNMMINLFSK